MKHSILAATAIAALFSTTTLASAVTIYSEAVDGDLDAIGSTNVNLVAGVNTITGSILATPLGDSDRIKFTQGVGMTVDSIVLSFAGVWDDANIGQSMNTALFNNVANLFDDNFNNVDSGASISASFMDTFGPETGPLSQDTDGAIWDFQLSSGVVFPDQPWTLTINTSQASVSPVPLPASALLLIGAVGGLGLMRRRKA